MEGNPSSEVTDLQATSDVESDAAEADEDDDNYADDAVFMNERCGICADVVIDRGVIDCCQHWFCFTCIDNWSTITTQCPLCKNEFQRITCLPVYDTIGNIKSEELLLSRDEDWSIQGRNNTLSFPSYYIDEDAVICLDGDQCKIRSGFPTSMEDLTLDTSIACDSCDIWYHAFCVGFNPECTTSEKSWLCPRCITEETQLNSSGVLVENLGKTPLVNTSQHGWTVDSSFTEKVSVSVADDGETAVVVSMVGGQSNLDPCKSFPSEVLDDSKSNNELEASLSANTGIEMDWNGVLDTSAAVVCEPSKVDFNEQFVPFKDSATSAELTISLHDNDDQMSPIAHPIKESVGAAFSFSPSYDDSDTNEESEKRSNRDYQLNLSVTTSSDGTFANNEMDITDDVQQKSNKISNSKRKHRGEMQSCNIDAACSTSSTIRKEMRSLRPAKKVKSDGNSLMSSSGSKVKMSVFDKSKSNPEIAGPSGFLEETIVREVHRSCNGKNEKDNATGLRVKKILRRGGEEKESSILIQNLGKQIRQAVQDKTSDSIGNSEDFDIRLLTAFRAAIVKPKVEQSNKLGPSRIGMKKSFLQKGSIRENLTKKIYGTSTGRRKHDWSRDCEIEFWKHRSARSKSEKVDTLHSVLEALKKATNSKLDTDPGPDMEAKNSILSRVYLADASVFPRKDDIKPLSAHAGSSHIVDGSRIAETSAKISKCLEPAKTVSLQKTKSTHVSESTVSKGLQKPKEAGTNPDNTKIDKRKWAMEVLARKNASSNLSVNRGNEDDKQDALKKNYPLLAQLPIDMRPVLSPGHNKKIPLSVRQIQLYRITENYLRKTNLPVMRRTADTELAVADAVNIEKGIFEKSNSKLVYINLCSNALSQCCNKPSSAEAVSSSSNITVATDQAEERSSQTTAGRCNNIDEALKLAGLWSDSPPSSPPRPLKDGNEAADPHENSGDKDIENVLDSDFCPDLDIYGDFEYDLEDEAFVGASTLLQQNDGSKLKVVLSTLKLEESSNTESYRTVNEKTTNRENGNKERIGYDTENVGKDSGTDLTQKLSGEIYEEPSLAECEELYGPEELSVKNMRDETTREMNKHLKVEQAAENRKSCDSDKHELKGDNSIDNGGLLSHMSRGTENLPANSSVSKNSPKEREVKLNSDKPLPDATDSVSKKVEAYIKEHIRPLCKSGVITVDQYRWAVKKATDKVMKFHSNAKSASFLIKEGEKVKKLAMEYVEASQQEK